MIKKVNPTHKVLVKYLKTINSDVEIRVLLTVEAGTSKQSKKSKVDEAEVPVTNMKKPKSKSLKNKPESDTKRAEEVVAAKPSKETVHKVQVSSKRVIVRDIPTPSSPSSKKRRAQDVVKHISKKRYKQKSFFVTIRPKTKWSLIHRQFRLLPW
ncbi:unnamed protein product [Lactuca virosa]|uniref:Uncharacterized protein n=1 Tax=Lactuca virosa TaxID=75947 RepID=A0AAU9MJQ2_9ASTR|nr:unnamed protein product [Lactuca virosa]